MTMIHIIEEEIEVRPSPVQERERGLMPLSYSSSYEQGYQGVVVEEEQASLSLDILEQNIPESARLYHDTELLKRDPKRMAELAQTRIQDLQFDATCLLVELGYNLYWANELQLWRYVEIEGVNSMKDWEAHMGLKSTVKADAQALYKIWPGMRDLGYPLQQLMDGSITTVKAQAINHELKDFIRQEKTRKPKVKVSPVETGEQEPWDSPIIVESIPLVPEQDDEEEASITNIKAKIEDIILSKDTDVVANLKAKNNQPEPAKLSFRDIKIRPDGLATAIITFNPEEEQMRQMARGYIRCFFPQLDGSESYFTLQDTKEFDDIIELLGQIMEKQPRNSRHSIAYDEDDL